MEFQGAALTLQKEVKARPRCGFAADKFGVKARHGQGTDKARHRPRGWRVKERRGADKRANARHGPGIVKSQHRASRTRHSRRGADTIMSWLGADKGVSRRGADPAVDPVELWRGHGAAPSGMLRRGADTEVMARHRHGSQSATLNRWGSWNVWFSMRS